MLGKEGFLSCDQEWAQMFYKQYLDGSASIGDCHQLSVFAKCGTSCYLGNNHTSDWEANAVFS